MKLKKDITQLFKAYHLKRQCHSWLVVWWLLFFVVGCFEDFYGQEPLSSTSL